MHILLTATLFLINLFLVGMLFQVIITPRDNVILIEGECPQVQECEETLVVREACDPEVILDSCIAEKFQYGEQLTEIDKILNPNKFIEEL